MARYLVSGAAGFIGAHLSEKLMAAGHSVVGVDCLNDAYDVRLKEYRLRRLQQLAGFDFYKLDLADRSAIQDLQSELGRVDAVFHLAARAGVREVDPWPYVESNVHGTLNLLELCHRLGISKFVMASTSSVYRPTDPIPYSENALTDLPMAPYAATKRSAEMLCYTYHYQYDLDVSICRYFNVYGPSGRPESIAFRLAQWISEGQPVRLNGDGTQSRGFTYVDDIVRGTLLALKPLGYEIINLGGSELVSMNALIRLFEDQIGRKAILQPMPRLKSDVMANLANADKAFELLGWKPEVLIAQGVSRVVEWYRSERELASQIITA
jgi:nucleoside-diphosphate-sugar epimerase